jgi:DNA-binding XRE family transcriptional regulator
MSNLAEAVKALNNPKPVAPATGPIMPSVQITANGGSQNNVTKNADSLKNELLSARINKGWTQRQLASHAGVSQGSIARLEKGLYTSLWMLLRVTTALRMQLTTKPN